MLVVVVLQVASRPALEGQPLHSTCHAYVQASFTNKATAGLLRYAALHRRRQRCNHRIQHLSGVDDRMGDDASRKFELSDAEFLTHFNRTHPQKKPWKLCHPTEQTSSAVTSLLCRSKSSTEYLQAELRRPTPLGQNGSSSAPVLDKTQASAKWMTQYHSSAPSASDGETVASHPLGTRLALEQQRAPRAKWARRFPHWGPLTRG